MRLYGIASCLDGFHITRADAAHGARLRAVVAAGRAERRAAPGDAAPIAPGRVAGQGGRAGRVVRPGGKAGWARQGRVARLGGKAGWQGKVARPVGKSGR